MTFQAIVLLILVVLVALLSGAAVVFRRRYHAAQSDLRQAERDLFLSKKTLADLGFDLKDAVYVANRSWASRELALARLMVITKVANGEMDPELRKTLPKFDVLKTGG